MTNKRKALSYTITPVIIFVLTYWIYFRQAIQHRGDINAHMQLALSLDRVLTASHSGWHFLTWVLYACLPISIEIAAAASTALYNMLAAMIVLWIIDRYMGHTLKTVTYPTVISLVALLVGPCYLRFYNINYLLGQSTPNIWHNPTTTAVRPFMFLVTVLTLDYWEETDQKKKRNYAWILMILLLLSTWIKPSFLMAYAPVCFIYIMVRLIKGRGRNFLALVCENLYFIPSLLLFLSQYIRIFIFGGAEHTEATVEIAFFRVARIHSPSIVISILLKMAFPVLVLLIWRKEIFKDKLIRFVFWLFIVGLLTSWTFAETGKRAKSGNFGWGNVLASGFLWLLCLIYYCVQLRKDAKGLQEKGLALKVKYGVPAAFLLWHLTAGITSLPIYVDNARYLKY